jgi:soluble lytic murein transglycosylase
VWQRIALAMTSGEPRLAAYLSKSLPAEERIWAERWIAIYRDPWQVLVMDDFAEAHPYRTRMLAQGIARLAPKAPSQAADLWDRIAARLDFPAEQARQVNAAVGFTLSAGGDRRGLSYLDRISARQDDFGQQERRLRTALKLGSWEYVANWIAAMPGGQRKSEHWLYWQARAEEIRGNAGTAQDLFEAASAERCLWGFLAAERTGHPYKLGDTPTPADPQRLERIEQGATAARIRELEALGRARDLVREWQWLTRDMSNEDLLAAAALAQRRRWPKRASLTLAKSGYWDDLTLRFPLLHRDIVSNQAAVTDLDTSWIFAVLRQESIFDPKAQSRAGAIGLMQLMPATAQEVAASLGLPRPARDELFAPRLNITLGSAYLAGMQRRFGGNMVLATAAYNAGPSNVDRWLPGHPVDADIWIATIPWHETRGYVRRVLAYRLIYDYRLGRPITPLRGIMRRIGKKTDEDLGPSGESRSPDRASS